MATEQDCLDALHRLAGRLESGSGAETHGFDRSLSCTVRDLEIVFAGRLHDGRLTDIRRAGTADAQIRLELSSDDLVALVDGELRLASAWATKRVAIHGGVRDLIKLRSLL